MPEVPASRSGFAGVIQSSRCTIGSHPLLHPALSVIRPSVVLLVVSADA